MNDKKERQASLKNVLSSFENYKKQQKQIKQQVSQGQKEEINSILQLAENILDDPNRSPIILLNAIRLIKDCLDTKNEFLIEGFYKSKIIQKMHQIALFQAGNENEDRGEEYFGSNVEEEVQVIGNSLLRLVLECFMFWPLMFEQDQLHKRNKIGQMFDDLTTKNVHFPENINYFKSFYKQLNLEQHNQGTTIQTQTSNSKQLSQETFKQNTEDENRSIQGQSNTSSPKKKKKKEVNLKVLEQKLDEENQKMEKSIKRLGKLVLVPTYLQLNKQEVKEIIESLQLSSQLANTIFQVLEEVQDIVDAELLSKYVSLNEKTDEILIDYQQLTSSNMKFDDFSVKHGITPTSSNEIKLLSEQDLQVMTKKFSGQDEIKNKNLQLPDEKQEVLVVEDLDFDGDSPAYKNFNQTGNSLKNNSQPQIIESAKNSKQNQSVIQSQDLIKKSDSQIQSQQQQQQQNKNNYYETYQDFEVPSLQQKQSSNNKEEPLSKQKPLIQLQKTEENQNKKEQIITQNQNEKSQNYQKNQQETNTAQMQKQKQQVVQQPNLNTEKQQHKIEAPPNSLQRSPNNTQQKQNSEYDEYDYADEDEEELDEIEESGQKNNPKIENQVILDNKNQKQQMNEEQDLKNNKQQTAISQNINQNVKRVSKVENSDPIQNEIEKSRNQPDITKKSKVEDNQNNVLKEKKNQNQTNKQQGSHHSIYNEEDIMKNIQTLNTEQSQGFVNENKQKKINQDQMKLSYNSRQSVQNNSMSGSQYERVRSSSFKQLFEDPVHIQIMQQNIKRTSIPRGPTSRDDQINQSINENNRQSGYMSEKEKKEIQSLKERLQVLSKLIIEKDQTISSKNQEILSLKNQIQDMDKQNTERISKIENQSTQVHYQLQLMNDEVSARDSVLEQNQKQIIILQQKYDQLHHINQELQLRCKDYESEIEEKNQELKYLKLQDQNNNENLLEDDGLQQLNMQINQLKLNLNQKDQEINNIKNQQQEAQEQKETSLEYLEQNNKELQNQVNVLKQEVQNLRNQVQKTNQQKQQGQDNNSANEELMNAQDIISSQETIMKQKESAIQEFIFKNGQLKEKIVQLEQEISENKAAYQKNIKSLKNENEQAKQILDPLQKENAEMFELLSLANMELDQLKQKVIFYEGQEASYKQEKTTTRDQMEKLSMENVRVSCELQQQKEFLTQQQQQIKDLTCIIQQLKNDNFIMSQQVKSGMSLIHSSDKLFLNLPEGDNNGSQKFGQTSSSRRSNAPFADKQNKQNSNTTNQQTKKAHYETFGQQQLQEMSMGIQNTEEQEIQYLLDADKMKQFLDQNQTDKEEEDQNLQEINQNNQQNVPNQKQLSKSGNQSGQESPQQLQQQLKKNDSDQNLTSIKNREQSAQKKVEKEQNSERLLINKQSISQQKLVISDRKSLQLNNQQQNEKWMEYSADKSYGNNIYGQYDSVQKSSSKKQNLQNSSDISQFYSYQGRVDDQSTPKAPSVRPSFVREIQSPRRRSMKYSQYQNNSKNLGYMSFNQEEFEKNNQQSGQLSSNRQDLNEMEQIPEIASTIQSGQNTIYYSNNNTIEQAENNDLNNQNINSIHPNQLRATPIKENFQKQKRLDKLQSLSDYLKTQSKKKGFSPMNTGSKAIKIPYNQTAEFEITMNNESKMNTLQQELSTLDNQFQTEKIKLEVYQDQNEYENDSESESNNNQNNLIQSPQNIELIQYAEEDNLSQISQPIKIQDDNSQNNENFDSNQLIVQRTQMEDFSSKVSNYEDTQQNEINRQSQIYYQQLIYPHQPDQYYIQKSMESSKLKSGLVISYEEDFFNNLKILSHENLNRFKKSCLSDKSLLFENQHIKIGVTNHNHIFSGKNFVKLQIYIFNKNLLNDVPSFNLKYLMNEDVSVWTKPEKLSGEIKINKHLKQDLIVDLNCIPFEFLTAHFQLEVESDDGKRVLNEYFMMLPTSLNRFMNFSLINANNFKSKWLVNQINSFKTEEFEYNTKIIKNPFVFLTYFANTVELNPHMKEEHLAGLQDYKIGGIFSFYHMESEQFLIKIIVKPFNKLQIQISPSNGQSFSADSSKCCHYLLQTLYFLFKYNPLDGINSEQNAD